MGYVKIQTNLNKASLGLAESQNADHGGHTYKQGSGFKMLSPAA